MKKHIRSIRELKRGSPESQFKSIVNFQSHRRNSLTSSSSTPLDVPPLTKKKRSERPVISRPRTNHNATVLPKVPGPVAPVTFTGPTPLNPADLTIPRFSTTPTPWLRSPWSSRSRTSVDIPLTNPAHKRELSIRRETVKLPQRLAKQVNPTTPEIRNPYKRRACPKCLTDTRR